jgi:hypothetical protein
MFSLFSRSSRSRSSARVRKAQPWLESLETRAVPTMSTGFTPMILNAYAVQSAQQQVDIKGVVYDPQGSNGDTILLGGGGGLNASFQVNSDGTFDYQVQGSSFGPLGGVSATAVNDGSLAKSAQVIISQDGNGPVITNFAAAHGYGNTWTFSGTVQSQTPNQTTVQLGNLQTLQGVTVPCDSNGNFSITLILNGTSADSGLATAIATDGNGQVSEEAMWWVETPY